MNVARLAKVGLWITRKDQNRQACSASAKMAEGVIPSATANFAKVSTVGMRLLCSTKPIIRRVSPESSASCVIE